MPASKMVSKIEQKSSKRGEEQSKSDSWPDRGSEASVGPVSSTTLGRFLLDFGHHFAGMHWFWHPKCPKIDPTSIKNRLFLLLGAVSVLLRSRAASCSCFCIVDCSAILHFSLENTVFSNVVCPLRPITLRTTSHCFSTFQGLQKSIKTDQNSFLKPSKKRLRKHTRFSIKFWTQLLQKSVQNRSRNFPPFRKSLDKCKESPGKRSAGGGGPQRRYKKKQLDLDSQKQLQLDCSSA